MDPTKIRNAKSRTKLITWKIQNIYKDRTPSMLNKMNKLANKKGNKNRLRKMIITNSNNNVLIKRRTSLLKIHKMIRINNKSLRTCIHQLFLKTRNFQ